MDIIRNQIEQALHYQQVKQFEKAHQLFEKILNQSPDNPDALHGMGLNYAMQKKFSSAIPFFLAALRYSPLTPAFHNNLANTYKAQGDLDKALRHYHEALRLKAYYPEAHNNLGNLLVSLGQINNAIEHFQKALRINPQAIDAHHNLANCYLRVDRLSDAVPHYRYVLKEWPEHIGAHYNLGLTLCALKDYQAAKPHLEITVKAEPENIDALYHLGLIYSAEHENDKAVDCYIKALNYRPNYAEAHHNLAVLYINQNQDELALKHFKAALSIMPSNHTASHMIAALSKEKTDKAPNDYVKALFDQYAYNYDEHLTSQLDYQVPIKIREILNPILKDKNKPWMVLDMGCGTGLMAPYLCDFSEKLFGVDISTNMIEIAKSKGGYEKLYTAEISQFFKENAQKYHLIVAADVLVYFGELELLFSQVFNHLMDEGYFCFTVEDSQDYPYQLMTSGRYSHHKDYLIKIIDHHYHLISTNKLEIRKQNNHSVIGNLYLIKRKNN